MRVIGFRLLQVVFAVLLLAIAFWPGWGLAYAAWNNIETSPYIITVGAAIWIMLLGLNLPLTRRQFQFVGAGCILAVIAVVLLSLGVFAEGANSDKLIITAIIAGGIMLGWFTISSHIWRSYRGVYGVDDADSGANE